MQKIACQKEVEIHTNKRNSSIELFRIITMLVIVAHHYVVNSGITNVIAENDLSWKSLFLLVFGWGGKTGINCFVFITGYFMCKSNITLKKFLKLILELEFYNIVIYMIFVLTGYAELSIGTIIKTILPIYGIGSGFTHSFLVFYLLIPFVNILVHGMNEKQFQKLILLSITVFTILPTFCFVNITMNYVIWFVILYLCAAYVRICPKKIFDNTKIWKIATIVLILLSWASVIVGAYVSRMLGGDITYYFVNDSNKILALSTAVSGFMCFKNLEIGYNKWVNKIAASAFGVLIIHSNSDVMRKWLWQDVVQSVKFWDSNYIVIHAIVSVLLIYIICTCIDAVRIEMIERPFFVWFDKIESKGKK